MTVLKLAATGHRPDKLGGWNNEHALIRITQLAYVYLGIVLRKETPTELHAISGMALGWDTAWALAALMHRDEGHPVKLVCAVPFSSQPDAWQRNPKNVERWHDLVRRADQFVILAENPRTKYEAARFLNDRNLWMVEQADSIVALWNGDHTSTNGKRSGTGNCVMDARKRNKPVTNLWPSWVKHSGLYTGSST